MSENDYPWSGRSSADDVDGAGPRARVVVFRTGQAMSRVHAHTGPFYQLFMRTMNAPEVDDTRHASGQAAGQASGQASGQGSAGGVQVAVDEIDMCCRHEHDALPSLARYHGAIITGSPAYLGEDESWMRWAVRTVRHIVEADLPLLAVCFGHQLIGEAFGGDVGPNPHGREMGTVQVAMGDDVDDDLLFGPLPRDFGAQVTHRDVIRAPGPHLKVLGTAPHDGCHVVRAGPRQWGVQFHPEFDHVTMRLYLENRRDVLDREHGPGATEHRLASLAVTDQAAGVLRRFAVIAHEEALRRGDL